MLAQFQSRYQRLEQSLQRLTDSIAAYNPSVAAADDLLAADEAINENLEQLITHQTNYQQIQSLRQTAEQLDETIKRTIQNLADTRREILAIPAVASAEEQTREINVEELLAYAKFISRTTVPATFRQTNLPALPAKANIAATNGTSSPARRAATETTGQEPDGRVVNVEVKIEPEATDGDAPAPAAEEDESKAWLEQKLPFESWPSQGHMQMGVLGDIQRMIDTGKDPASVLTAEEQADVDRMKKEAEEKEKAAQEEAERRRMSMFDTGALRRRETAGDVFNPDDL